MLEVQPHPALAVLEVREHGAAEQLLPQRLPEPLDLPAGLRVVRTALHVCDPVALEFRLELGLSAPRRVLSTLIGQDLPRRPVLRDPPRQRLHHQRAALVMGHRQTHQIARVIVEEGCHIDSLVLAQQEGEQIALPELVGLGAFKALRPLRAGLGFGEGATWLVLRLQYPPDRRLRGPQSEEAAHEVADASTARFRMQGPGRADRLPRGLLVRRALRLGNAARMVLQPFLAALAIQPHPIQCRLVRHTQLRTQLAHAHATFHHRVGQLSARLLRPIASTNMTLATRRGLAC